MTSRQGKSSVLEAISRQKFPTNDQRCTRYLHELDMPQVHVTRSISQSSPGPVGARPSNRSSEPSICSQNLTELPAVAKEAGRLMGLEQEGGPTCGNDVLRVAMSEPRLPPLTVVDLPGLFHGGVDSQTNDDAEFVKELVQNYMQAPRTIILAVASAKNNLVNQIVLKYACGADTTNKRTLGIITKPDLTESPGLANHILKVAQNEVRQLALGWHVLKNRSYADRHCSDRERDRSEAKFFSHEICNQLPNELKGIQSLKFRLSTIYHDSFVTSILDLKRDIQDATSALRTRLRELQASSSPSRTTDAQKDLYHASTAFTKSVTESVQTQRHLPPPGRRGGTRESAINQRHTLADLVHAFREKLSREGHAYELVEGSSTSGREQQPPQVRYRDFAEEISQWVAESDDVPCQFDANLVSELFYDRSAPWPDPVVDLFANILEAVKGCLHGIVQATIKPDIQSGITKVIVNPTVDELRGKMEEIGREKMDRHATRDTIDFDRSITDLVLSAHMLEDRISVVQGIFKHFLLSGEPATKRPRAIITDADVDSLADAVMEMRDANRATGVCRSQVHGCVL